MLRHELPANRFTAKDGQSGCAAPKPHVAMPLCVLLQDISTKCLDFWHDGGHQPPQHRHQWHCRSTAGRFSVQTVVCVISCVILNLRLATATMTCW